MPTKPFEKFFQRDVKSQKRMLAQIDAELSKYADYPKAVRLLTKMRKQTLGWLDYYERLVAIEFPDRKFPKLKSRRVN